MTVPAQRRHAVRAQQPDARRDLVVVGDDHAPLADREVLVREEAERAGQARASRGAARRTRDPAAWAASSSSTSPCSARERGERGDRPGMAAVGHGHDRLGARADRRGDGLGVEPGLVRAHDVGEHRRGAGVGDGVGRGDEGHRGDDDLVAGPEPGGERRRGAAPPCTLVTATAWPHAGVARRTPASSAAVCGPMLSQPDAETSATAVDVLLGHDHVGERHRPGGHDAPQGMFR